MNLLLFGFTRAGKTHFGKLAAARLGRPFFDTDQLIEDLDGSGLSYRDIFREKGSAHFRKLETEAIALVANKKQSVIALGGGAVVDPQNRATLLGIGKLVYLATSLATVEKRMDRKDSPLFSETSLRELFAKREPLYNAIPAARIDTTALSGETIVTKLMEIAKADG